MILHEKLTAKTTRNFFGEKNIFGGISHRFGQKFKNKLIRVREQRGTVKT